MCHCGRLSLPAPLSCLCKVWETAHFSKTFSITASSLHRQEQSLRLPLQTEQRLCTALIPAEFAGKESCKQSRAAPGMQICSHSLPPRQVHSEFLPPAPADAELPPQLCRLCCSAWQELIQSTQDHLVSF